VFSLLGLPSTLMFGEIEYVAALHWASWADDVAHRQREQRRLHSRHRRRRTDAVAQVTLGGVQDAPRACTEHVQMDDAGRWLDCLDKLDILDNQIGLIQAENSDAIGLPRQTMVGELAYQCLLS